MGRVDDLRESVEDLKEFMFSAAAFNGPDPDALRHLGQVRADLGSLLTTRSDEPKPKKPDIKPALRKLSVWLQKRGR